MDNFQQMYSKYAELAVKTGVNIQKGQPLLIKAPIECAPFVRLVAKNAYECGAKEVHVEWHDEELALLKYMNSPYEVFMHYPKWKAQGYEEYVKDDTAFLSIAASDPDLLKDVDPAKVAESNKSASIALKNYMESMMNDTVSWSVISIPTEAWAKKVFPNDPSEQAIKKLWQAIFKTVRVDQDDPVTAWQQHFDNLNKKVEFLNKHRFKNLHYTSPVTDLIVELPKDHIWAGGGEYNSKNIFFVPNMPTEEIFTMPFKDGVNGYVKSTKPLNYGGNIIDDFTLTFKDGKVIEFKAGQGQEILKQLTETDGGSRCLGEVALVPFDSPISQSNILFYNTLFDENASCHFALGKAYSGCIKGGNDMSSEEVQKLGANDSLIHVDFMVGSKDLDIVGETYNGQKVQIFKDGNWAF